MNKKRIGKKVLSLILTLCMIASLFAGMTVTASAAGSASYEKLSISNSSLNGNAIWGVNELWSSSITLDKSAAFYVQNSERNGGKGGLPVNGQLTMTSGVPYKLASGAEATAYDGNDCIRLYSGTAEKTMNLETVGVYEKIYVLATAGGPGEKNYARFSVTLNYTDGFTKEVEYKLYDWFDMTKVDNVEQYKNVMRRNNPGAWDSNKYNGELDGTPILHSATIEADKTRLLKSITFKLNGINNETNIPSNLFCGIFAVTGATPEGVLGAPTATAATSVKSTGFTANWNAVSGASSYRLDVATSSDFTSGFVSGYNNLTVSTNSCSVTGLTSGTTYYYRVRAVNSVGAQSLSSNVITVATPSYYTGTVTTNYASAKINVGSESKTGFTEYTFPNILESPSHYVSAETSYGCNKYVNVGRISADSPTVAVNYYPVTFNATNGGAVTATCNNSNIASNTYVLSGQTVSFKADSYVGSGVKVDVPALTVSSTDHNKTIPYYPVKFSATGTGTGSLGAVKAYWENGSNDKEISTSGTNVLSGQTVRFEAESFAGSASYVGVESPTTVVNPGITKEVQYYPVTFNATGTGGTGSLGTVKAYWENGSNDKEISTSGTNVLKDQSVYFKAESFAGSNNYVDVGSSKTVGTGITEKVQYYPVTFSSAGTTYGAVTASCTNGGNISTSGKYVLSGQTVSFTATPKLVRTSYIKSINNEFDATKLTSASWNNVTVNAAKGYNVAFGNWEAELGAALTAATTDAAKAAVLYNYLDGTDNGTTDNYRAILKGLFTGMSDVMTNYDIVKDKYSIIEQYLTKMGKSATNITTDFNKGNTSDFAKMIAAQLKLEGAAAQPTVSVNNETGVLTIKPIEGVTYSAVTVSGAAATVTTGGIWTYNLTPENVTAGYVEITCTDANGYTVKEKFTVLKTTYTVEQTATGIAPAVGGTVDIVMKPGNTTDAALSNTATTAALYSLSNPQYQTKNANLDISWQTTTSLNDGPVVLTVKANKNGAYFKGFKVGNTTGILDTTAAKSALGTDASIVLNKNSSTDPADWVYTLTYTPAGVTGVTAQYRNLLGEGNLATDNTALEAVIDDDLYNVVIHSGSGKTINAADGTMSTTITGADAKAAFDALDTTPSTAEDKAAVLTKLRTAVTERGSDYTIDEFNDALYYASKLQKAIDEAEAKVEAVYTTGSWTERTNVLNAVKTEWEAADGDPQITTKRIRELYIQTQRALNQLIEKTLAVEIVTNADGSTNIVKFSATSPEQNDIAVADGQNGYAFPVYNSKVTLAVTRSAIYDVVYKLDGTDSTESAVTAALANVMDHHQVEVIFTKQTVEFTPFGATETVQVNKGEDIIGTLTPGDGEIIIPNGTVTYTVDDVTSHTAIVDASGSFTIPAAKVTGDIKITKISDAVGAPDKTALNTLLNLADDFDNGQDKVYGSNDYTYTQNSWESLFGTAEAEDPQVYGGAYGDALAVSENSDATAAQIKTACDKLRAAIDNLKPQYAVSLSTEFTIADGQTGVVKLGETYYVQDGGSVALDVTVDTGKKLNKVTYKMGGNDYTAWEAGGKVTLYGVTGAITDLSADTSDKGFSVAPVSGGIGAATGEMQGDKKYVLTPEEGNELTSITVDGVKSTAPNIGELEGIISAAFTDDWTDNKKTVSVNGKDVVFSQVMSGDEPPVTTGAVTATLPGMGEVSFEVSGSAVTVTVTKAGSLGYVPGSIIGITTDGAPGYNITDVKLTPKDAGYNVDFGTPAGGATVEWNSENSGNHGVTATTTLETYNITIGTTGDPVKPVGGIIASAATVKHGGSVTLTIPAPAETTQEVAMSSTVTAIIGTKTYTNTTLTDLVTTGYAVTIQSNGSAKVVINNIDGETNITAANIGTVPKGTVSDADKLQQDKNNFTERLSKLKAAIDEAEAVNTNAGKIYDETPDLDDNLNEKNTLKTTLGSITLDDITDEAELIDALKTALGIEPTEEKTITELLDMIELAADELTQHTNDAKTNFADGVIEVVTGGTPTVSLTPAAVADGKLNPGAEGGSDLVISGIQTEPGYMPIITIIVGGEKKPFKIVEKDGGYGVVEPIYGEDGNITSWKTTPNEDITVNGGIDPTKKIGNFTLTIPNANIINVLGKDTDDTLGNDKIDNITAATTESYLTGHKLPTAQSLYEGTFVSAATKGVSQLNIDIDNDGDADFKVGTENLNETTVPVVAGSSKAAISFIYAEDSYEKGGNTWYKSFAGLTLDGMYYPANALPAGITFEETIDSTLARKTGGVLTIDTLKYTGELTDLQLLFEPTNSQYTTWSNEFNEAQGKLDDVLKSDVDLNDMSDDELLAELGIADITTMESGDPYYNDLYKEGEVLSGEDLTSKLKELVTGKRVDETELADLDTEKLEAVIKLVNRLVDQAKGDPATSDYFLTQENKDYHSTEIEQLKQLQQRLDQLVNAKDVYDDIEAFYKDAIETDGLSIPAVSPMSDAQKGIVLNLAGEIEQLEQNWDELSEKEKLLVGAPAPEHLKALTDAVTLARESGMTEEELFRSRVLSIKELITGDSPYTITDPDKVADMITQAQTQYDGMTNEQRASVADSKQLLEECETKLDAHLDNEAAEFTKKWLTTDYTGTSDSPGDKELSSGGIKLLDSEPEKPGYTHRVSLANTNYNALPTSVKAAVDKILGGSTVPTLYAETFKEVNDIASLTDEELADAFIANYLTVGGSVIKNASYTNYSKILQTENPWKNLSSSVQNLVNKKLGTDASKIIDEAKAINDNLDDAQTFINNNLRYDGSVVTAGNSTNKTTITEAKPAWDGLSTAVQEAVNYKLVNTYMGKTYPALYDAVSDKDSSSGGSSKVVTAKVPVIVDGVEYNIGTAKTENGVTTVTIDQTELQKQLDAAKETVIVPVTPGSGANTVTAQFVVANIDEMAEKEITLSVQVDDVSYNMRAFAIDTEKLMTELGATDPANVPVNVTITELSEDDVTLENGELVLPPVSFTVTASYGGKSVEVEVFKKYVQRVIEVPNGIDANKITTGVVVENGKQRHVPTRLLQKESKWYAEINSLTNSKYALIYNEVNFNDDDGKWFEDVVTEMASRCIITGRGEGIFDGDANITRTEFAAILVRALGLPENGDASAFTDVAESAWYYGAVGKAYEYGLINGRSESIFDPDVNITRQEAMAMVHRAAAITEFTGTAGSLAAFSDADSIQEWALNDAQWNVGSGLIQGNSAGKICGKENITRGETATIILRLLQKSELVDVRTNA